jgi:hypothetical protein
MPAMDAINKFFPPAGWFIPSLVVCQQVLILIPLRDAFKSRPRESSESENSDTATLTSTTSHSSSSFDTNKSPQIILNKELKPKASMQALEFSIEHSIESLISWAASREFTAENAIFLREVRNFKKKWGALRTVTTSQRRQMFTEASLIFFTLINPFTAETPINIEYKIFRKLQQTFSDVEFDPYMPKAPGTAPASPTRERENVVCPWEDTLDRPASIDSNASMSSTASTRSIVPSQFTEEVFDAAFESIKYLVFTNTWPRYVEADLAKNSSPSP